MRQVFDDLQDTLLLRILEMYHNVYLKIVFGPWNKVNRKIKTTQVVFRRRCYNMLKCMINIETQFNRLAFSEQVQNKKVPRQKEMIE